MIALTLRAVLLALPLLLTGLALLLVLRHVAKGAHAFTQVLDGLGLPLHRAGLIAIAQRLLGLFHRTARIVQIAPRLLALGRAAARQKATLATQILAQRALAIGQAAALTLTLALALPLLLAVLPFALLAVLPLTRLPLTRLPLTRLAFALLTLLSGRLPLAELVLHLSHRLIGQPLLLAQRLAQLIHRTLLAFALAALALGDAQVLHHAVELLQKLLRLGHAALIHQALDLIHHLLDLVAGDLLALLTRAVEFLGRILLTLLGQHIGIGIRRLAQFIHQALHLIGAGAVADGFGQPLLRLLHALQGIGQTAIPKLHRRIPQHLR